MQWLGYVLRRDHSSLIRSETPTTTWKTQWQTQVEQELQLTEGGQDMAEDRSQKPRSSM